MLPTVINDLSWWCVPLLGGLLVGGYLTHELLHVIPLAVTGADYEVEFNPGEKGLLWNLTVGRAFEFRTETSPTIAIVSLLAPGLLLLPGLALWAFILYADYVSLTLALATATWIIVFLPSLADWVETGKEINRWRGKTA